MQESKKRVAVSLRQKLALGAVGLASAALAGVFCSAALAQGVAAGL